jgi:hypothetical protein
MQIGELLMPATDVRVGSGLRHLAAMLLALTVIGHILIAHGQLLVASGSSDCCR